MYDICHPTYYNMSQLGCNDQVKLTTAFYVYMELCEVKRYWDVEYNYCDALQIFYLEARKNKNDAKTMFIPWPASHNISLNFISNIQRLLEKDKFTFVFKEGDTTSVYYSISSGIIKPISPEHSKEFKQKEEKKLELEREINRNTANLYERALSFDTDDNEEINDPTISNIKEEKPSEQDIELKEKHKIENDQSESFELKFSSDSDSVDKISSNKSEICENTNNLSEKCEKSERIDNIKEQINEERQVSTVINSGSADTIKTES